MLEYWYKERRTLADFRRGALGPYMDGLAARLKERGYSRSFAVRVLGNCCIFNSFLIDQRIKRGKDVTLAHFESFITAYLADFRTASKRYVGRGYVWGSLKHLVSYLVDNGVMKPPAPKPLPTQYRWVLEPYLYHLQEERQLKANTIQNYRQALCRFLDGLGERTTRKGMKALKAEDFEDYITQHIKESPENLRNLVGYLKGFLRFCTLQGYVVKDFSSVIPSIPAYRLASLPKGMEDTDLQRTLNVIPKGTAVGARDTAIMLLMMAYGIRGMSVVELRLEDIDWQRSTILIRARKGGKEVVLPLLEAVGEAIIQYLHHRPETRFREVFLGVRAPHFPLNGQDISTLVRKYMSNAGVKKPKSGSNTLRHSWAIRALAEDSPMKAIADVLGHRCLNTTFIYAKADLKMLRQVAMPWPKER